jgi:hypothetical protein
MQQPMRTLNRARLRVVAAAAIAATVVPLALATSPASASPLGPFSCLPTAGIGSGTEAQADRLMAGYLTIPGFREVYIGTGHINWGMNPFRSVVWQKYFTSLRWTDLLTSWYIRHPDRHPAYLPRAERIATDWAAYNPPGGGPAGAVAWTGMYAGQRATVYSCLHSLNSSYGVAPLRAMGPWLANTAHDPGDWNQGVDFNLGLLAAGCVTGTSTWAAHARSRLESMATSTIDPSGAVGEEAPGYGPYLYKELGLGADRLQQCLGTDESGMQSQRSKLLTFLGWATMPNGIISEIGDTVRQAPPAPPTYADAGNSVSEWAASLGAAGIHPAAAAVVYNRAGYAFGRTGWDPFTAGAYYSLRFGPGRKLHGHNDHEQLTFYAYGKQLLMDSGLWGYTSGAFRDYLLSPSAHNVVTLPGVSFNATAATSLLRSNGSQSAWQWYELSDTAYGGRTRMRETLVNLSGTPFAMVYDRVSRATTGPIQQLWHLPPGTKVSLVGRGTAVATTADGKTQFYLVQLPVASAIPSGATGVVTGRTSPYQGWVSETLGHRSAAPVVVMSRYARSAGMFTALVPAPAGTAVHLKLSRDATNHLLVTVTVGSTTTVAVMSSGGSMWIAN